MAPRLEAWRTLVDRLANRPLAVVVAVGLAGFLASAGAGLLRGIPDPQYHDEFSYLLAADTFAAGRLTNPTHPMWTHFETFHVIHQPSYASKFPPAQGLAMAAGLLLFGHPIAGVWLSVGLMCAAIAWMLLSWVPPRWALFGGAIAILQFGVLGAWAQSYWGGAVAATGGALVFGGLRRMVTNGRARDAVAFGVGLLILANSRPFEGLLVALPALVMLASRHREYFLKWRERAPGVVLLVAGVAAMAFYNYRVTGDPLRLPYQVHEQTYRVEPVFLWRAPNPTPDYRHARMREFHTGFELKMYANQQPIGGYGYRVTKLDQFIQLWSFFLGPLLTLPLVLLPWTLRDRWMRLALASCCLLAAGLLLETWVMRHYAAPAAALVLAIVVQSLKTWVDRDAAVGRFVASVVAVGLLGGVALTLASDLRGAPPPSWHHRRAALLRQLESQPGPDLVIVRYAPGHSVQNEWVFNAADIDAAGVVWARDLGADQNRALVAHFRDRQIWSLDIAADDTPALTPYPVDRH